MARVGIQFCESGDAVDLDETAADGAWAKFRRDNPNYKAHPEHVTYLRGATIRRERRQAALPSREERQRTTNALFAKLAARR